MSDSSYSLDSDSEGEAPGAARLPKATKPVSYKELSERSSAPGQAAAKPTAKQPEVLRRAPPELKPHQKPHQTQRAEEFFQQAQRHQAQGSSNPNGRNKQNYKQVSYPNGQYVYKQNEIPGSYNVSGRSLNKSQNGQMPSPGSQGGKHGHQPVQGFGFGSQNERYRPQRDQVSGSSSQGGRYGSERDQVSGSSSQGGRYGSEREQVSGYGGHNGRYGQGRGPDLQVHHGQDGFGGAITNTNLYTVTNSRHMGRGQPQPRVEKAHREAVNLSQHQAERSGGYTGSLRNEPHQRQQQSSKPDRVMVPERIQEWLKQPVATCLVFDLSAAAPDLSLYLKTTPQVPADTISGLVTLLHRAVFTNQRGAVNRIIQSVLQSYFLDGHFILFLDQQQTTGTLRPDTPRCLHQVLDIVEYAIEQFPEHGAKCNYSLQQIVNKGQQLGLMATGNKLMVHAKKLIKLSSPSQFQGDQEPFHCQHSVGDLTSRPGNRKAKVLPDHDEALPPDDYQQISIFPDTEELFDGVVPFLRANKTSGKYRDQRHYLDVHSRLLKEDYLEPIRRGLKDYKEAQEKGETVKEDNLRFYYGVKLVKMKCDERRGITHIVQFDKESFEHIEWEHSRRLMFGSLLVLSKDGFDTTAFATVSDHTPSLLEQGFVEVTFENNLEQIFTSSEFDVFVMAETTAYFESYRHVLEGLQEMRQLPLSRYILSCEKNIYPPSYQLESPEVDVSCIASPGRCLAPVEILDEDDWPDASSTVLNESQLDAMKLALTKEMAIIQGPPGTGKTYVGLKIMNILLQQMRQKKWNELAPILVVCFTNHALDQFLEGMLGFCKSGIVRVGGRSSSEVLQNFNLRELRKDPKMKKHVFGRHVDECKKQLKMVAEYIETYWQQSLKQETNIVTIADLKEEIGESHKRCLEDPRRQSGLNPHVIRVWLRATNANMENHMTKAAIRRLAQVIAVGEDSTPDTGIENALTATRPDFWTRVKIYRCWAGIYRMRLESKVDQHIPQAVGQDTQLEQLLQEQELVNEDILTDEKLIPLMRSEEIFEFIKECVENESKGFDSHNGAVVKEWLLGKFATVDSVLDAIERLTKSQKSASHNRGRRNERVDTEEDLEDRSIQRKQWVLSDSDEDEDDEEDDDEDDDVRDDSDGVSENGDMQDIDDLEDSIRRIQRSQFRDISREYEQFENREIQIYQRAQILGVDMSATDPDDHEEEWQEGDTLSHSKVFKLLHSVPPFTEEEASDIRDVWDLELRERYRLYKYWVQLRKEKLTARLIDLTKEYHQILAKKRQAINMKDVAILRGARVIGMTTSGAAKHRAVLQKVGSQIVVVEEAAEVLEAHIITALNVKVKHLILIGDHQQLRPSPTVYRLAVDYGLEISLFERLVNNGVPCVMLDEQHRMRPEIAQFVRHIYPALQDHGSVHYYGDIQGVASNVFFLQHDFEEREVDDSSSKANTHEAHFITALCKYFLQQGYEGSQITILAAYGGQVDAIKETMEPEESRYEPVRLTSIDNYQGEENDIVLLSLVRSNKENMVGFLKTDNRVCVALSRAKKGLFVIGNLKQIASKSSLWKKILQTAKATSVTGVHMPLVCVNHTDHVSYVNSHEDFQREVPEGGCSRPCGAQLACGHICNLTCHSWDRFHQDTPCKQPCLLFCPEGHPCPLTCAEECGPCQVPVKRVLRDCNHEDTVLCYEDVNEHLCKQPCQRMLPCGHECRGVCGHCSTTGKHAPCLEKVEKTWPACEHKNTTECHIDPTVEPCPTRCKEVLNCEHKCKGTCGGCLGGKVHRPCQDKCKKPLPCGHPCEGPCGGVCMPCGRRCPTNCRHGRCPRTTCGELCQPCLENCAMVCSHSTCSRRCMDECFSRPCQKVCGKPVERCKHKCVSLCGERCVCFACGKDEFQLIDKSSSKKTQPKQVMAHEQRERARKFELTPDVILMKIPACGHVFTMKQLDRYVESLPSDESSYIPCPSMSCRAVLQGIRRYEDINKLRSDRRHARKQKLIEDTKVNFPELSNLRRSVAKIKAYCDIDEAKYLHKHDIDTKIDPNEAMAFRLHARYIYALQRMEQIDRKFNKEKDFKFNATRWKRAILNAKKSATPQFQAEMRQEMHRLLLSQQLIILNTLLRGCYTPLDGQTKDAISTLKTACKNKMVQRELETCQATMERLYQKLLDRQTEDFWHESAASLKSRSRHICICLDAPNDQDLCTLLDRHPDEDSSSQGDESDSDSDESEDDEGSEDYFSSEAESSSGHD